MKKHKIGRDGLPPIVFTGEHIGGGSSHSHQGPNQNRWTEVNIYRTKGGRYVWSLAHRTIWEGESNSYSGGSCATAAEVVEELKYGRDDTKLGSVSEEAVIEATKNDPAFAALWVEEVE